MTEQITYKTLDEVADVIDSAHKTPVYSDSGYPMVRATDIKGGILRLNDTKRVNKKTFEEFSKNYKCSKGDILITRVGSYGQFSYVNSDDIFCLGQNTAGIKPIIDSRFLYFCLLSPFVKNQIEQSVVGSTQKTLSLGHIKKLKIPVFKDAEIKAIAKILSSLDDKIELNRKMNATLEEMARGVFKAWFVDFEPVHANHENRPSTSASPEIAKLFPSEFQESELGLIPKGWEVEKINQVASNIQYGYTQSSTDENVGPKFLRITDIQGGKVDWKTVPYCETSEKDFEKYEVKPHDIFIARTGASTGENVYVIDSPEAVFASYLIRVQFEYQALAAYFGTFFRTEQYFNYVASILSGSAQPNANAQKLTNIETVIPSKNLLVEFFNIVHPFNKRRYSNQLENEHLSGIRDSLLPRLISGKIAVGEIEKEVGNAV